MHQGVFIFISQYLIPLIIFIWVYFSIMKSLRTKIKPSENKNQRNQQRLRNVNQTLMSMIFACILCQSLNQFIFFAFNFGYRLKIYGNLHNTSIILLFMNVCVNPFIYIYKYKLFRQEIITMFTGKTTNQVSSVMSIT